MKNLRNCYDFDKTIYKKDSSIAFLWFCIKKKPVLFFHLFSVMWLLVLKTLKIISTKTFKEKYFSFLTKIDNLNEMLDQFWKQEIKNVNDWYLQIKREDDVICSASPEFLLKGCFEQINPTAVIIATQIPIGGGMVKIAIEGENCKGEEKVLRIKQVLAGCEDEDGFLFKNGYSDSVSDFPMLDLARNKFIVCGKKYYPFGKQKPTLAAKLKFAVKQMRVKHYLKNGLIAFPLMFSGLLFHWPSLVRVVWCIIAFSLMASVIYIINDLIDVKNDRKHPKKRKRPIASYMIKPFEAIILAVVLFATSMLICCFALDAQPMVIILILFYGFFNFLYSIWLKKLPVIDLVALSICYLIRIFLGGQVIGIGVSSLLFLTILFAALFMGLGKRRNELKSQGDNTRKVNGLYSYEFLDKFIYVAIACIFIFYSLWAMEIRQHNPNYLNGLILLATIPMLICIMMKYCLDIQKTESSGDPMEVLFKDKWLILLAALFVSMVIIAVYVPISIPSWVG